MIKYKKFNNNIVELTVAGNITAADFDRVIAQLKADIQQHGKLRLLEEIQSFEGINPMMLWKDAQFGLNHMGDFTHVAVVADAEWVRTISAAVDSLLSAQVKAFERSQLEDARNWLATV